MAKAQWLKVYPVEKETRVMFQELVQNASKFSELDKSAQRAIARALGKLWLRVALLKKGGFFHGDPHLGNLLPVIEKIATRVNKFTNQEYTEVYITFYLLDFGMGGFVPFRSQVGVWGLSIGLFTKDTLLVAQSAEKLLPPNTLGNRRGELLAAIKSHMKEKGDQVSFASIIKVALDLGLPVPATLIGLERASSTIVMTIENAGKKLPRKFSNIFEAEILSNPISLFRTLRIISDWRILQGLDRYHKWKFAQLGGLIMEKGKSLLFAWERDLGVSIK